MIREEPPPEADLGELGARARNAAVWAILDRWVTRALTTVVFIILARLLTPPELGIVALALVARYFLGVFIDQGFSEAIVQTPELTHRYLNTAFWTALATGLLLMLVTIGTAPWVARDLLGDAAAAPLLRVLAISLIFTALSCTQSALLQRQLAFRELAIRRIVAHLVAGIAAVIAALLGAGAWSIVFQTLVQGGIGALILWRYSPWRPAREFHPETFRVLAAFGVSMVGIDILHVVQQQADNFLVGRSLGAAALGIYALAFRFFFVIVDITTSSMSGVALSTFAHVQADRSAARHMFLSATRVTSLVALPAFAGMAIVAPEMISVLVGNRWDVAAPILRALCPSGLVMCLTYLDRSLIIALGRPRLALGLTAGGVALRLVGYIIGVQFGVVGVAVGLSATSIVFWPCRLAVLRRLTNVSLFRYFRQMRSAVVASGALIIAVLVVRTMSLGNVGTFGVLSLEVLTGIVVYGIALTIVDRTAVRELTSLVGLLGSTMRSRSR
jgi:O-antigen/teichoic acid export membrane protein